MIVLTACRSVVDIVKVKDPVVLQGRMSCFSIQQTGRTVPRTATCSAQPTLRPSFQRQGRALDTFAHAYECLAEVACWKA